MVSNSEKPIMTAKPSKISLLPCTLKTTLRLHTGIYELTNIYEYFTAKLITSTQKTVWQPKGQIMHLTAWKRQSMKEELTKGPIPLCHLLAAWMRESAYTLQGETKTVNNEQIKIEAGLTEKKAGHWTQTFTGEVKRTVCPREYTIMEETDI